MATAACGHENPDSARFCSACGATLARACSGCQAPLTPDAQFCSQCGQSVVPGADDSRPARTSAATADGERRQVTVLFCDLVGSTELLIRGSMQRSMAFQPSRQSAAGH